MLLTDASLSRIFDKTAENVAEGACLFDANIRNTPKFGKVDSLADIFRKSLLLACRDEGLEVDESVLARQLDAAPVKMTAPDWRNARDARWDFKGSPIGRAVALPTGLGYAPRYVFQSVMPDNKDALMAGLKDLLTDMAGVSPETRQAALTAPALTA